MEPIVIEPWLHENIRQMLRSDAGFRRFMSVDALPRVTREDIDRYHLFLFRKTLAYAADKSVFYRDLLKQAGIKPEDIQTMEDISKLPFTEPDDIARQPYTFACVSLGDITSITTFASSGTTGPQKKVFVTGADLARMTDFMGIGMKAVAKAGDTVQVMLPSRRPNDQSALLALGVKKMGGLPVITGNALTAGGQIQKIKENHPSVLFGETAYLWRITKEAAPYHDLQSLGVKIIFVTAEHLAQSQRRQMEALWGCEVYVHYGMTEMGLGVSIECPAHDSYHFNEVDLMVEIIDPATGKVLGGDEEGEVVFTALNREAMPLLRYRTHDISRLVSTPCLCGAATLKKIAPVTRRREAIVMLAGEELHPSALDESLYTVPEVIDYQAAVSRDGIKNVLAVKVETALPTESLGNAIAQKLRELPAITRSIAAGQLTLSPVEFVPAGSLARMSRAKKLILDTRDLP